MAQPARVALSLGSTTRLNEFDFSKISLSLERDLVPAENPIDAYRDIKALLECMVTEFQGSKPVARGPQEPSQAVPAGTKTQQSSHANRQLTAEMANRALTSDFKAKESPTPWDNQAVSPRPTVSKSLRIVDNSSPSTSAVKPKESLLVADNHAAESVTVGHNQVVPPSPTASKPAGLTVETKWKSDLEIIHERLAKWLDKVEVTPTLNGFAVKPRHFLLRPTWAEIDTSLRVLGAKWIPAAKGVGSWIVSS